MRLKQLCQKLKRLFTGEPSYVGPIQIIRYNWHYPDSECGYWVRIMPVVTNTTNSFIKNEHTSLYSSWADAHFHDAETATQHAREKMLELFGEMIDVDDDRLEYIDDERND